MELLVKHVWKYAHKDLDSDMLNFLQFLNKHREGNTFCWGVFLIVKKTQTHTIPHLSNAGQQVAPDTNHFQIFYTTWGMIWSEKFEIPLPFLKLLSLWEAFLMALLPFNKMINSRILLEFKYFWENNSSLPAVYK